MTLSKKSCTFAVHLLTASVTNELWSFSKRFSSKTQKTKTSPFEDKYIHTNEFFGYFLQLYFTISSNITYSPLKITDNLEFFRKNFSE